MKNKPLLLIIFCIGFSFQNFGQNSIKPYPKKQYFTKRIQGDAPTVDGYLSDSCWGQVEWTSDYLQWSPKPESTPTEQTSFKILYDDKNLYIGYMCEDADPDGIIKRMSRRDGFPGDWVEINIDSYHDLRTAFSFTISVSGVKGDEFISNDGNNWDSNWNPIWYAKTSIGEEGWFAEIKIPFSQLRFGKQENQVWGIQSTRRYFRTEERSLWQPMRENDPSWVSRFGELHGLNGIEFKSPIELQPYVLVQAETFEAQEGNPFLDGKDAHFSAGLDGKIGLTSDLTLDFTINPDFGQVDADPGALTLDGFQIFFGERRPFFIENQNIFNFQITGAQAGGSFNSDLLFYSRRIGKSPARRVYGDSTNGIYAEQPDNTTILGAAKFSGKLQNGLSIGILESITQKEVATIDNNGERTESAVEPFSNYFVGRLQQDFDDGNTIIGGIFTAVNRNIEDVELEFLHTSAYSGGIDFIQKWDNRNYYFNASGLFSKVSGTTEAILNTQTSFEHLFQRPDANYLSVDSTKTSLAGHGGTLKVGKTGGSFRFETGATWRSPELELNDIGFLINTDEINHFTWLGYRWNKPFSIFRQLGVNYNHQARWNFDGQNLYRNFNLGAFANFKNFWTANIGFGHDNLDITKNALRGGPLLKRPNGYGFDIGIGTNQQKKFVFDVATNQGRGFPDAVNFQNYSGGFNWQIVNALRLSVNQSYSRFRRIYQYFTSTEFNGAARYLGGRVVQKTFATTIRVNFNITADLTIQFYGQPFISKGNFTNFRYISETPLADAYRDRHSQFSDAQIQFSNATNEYLVDENLDGQEDYRFGSPDFNFIQFRSNLVVRWEYTPGSELFFVWSQGQDALDDPSRGLFPSLLDNAFGQKPHNIFLVKGTYRFLR